MIGPDGQVDRKAYTFCALDQLRAHLRRRDVFLSQSYRWIDPRAKLLGGQPWESLRPSICRDLNLPTDPDVALAELSAALH